MMLSIIVPFYNEENTIGECLIRVNNTKIFPHIKKEIIMVNDGSTDKSSQNVIAIRKKHNIKDFILLKHYKNLGKGAAIHTGIKKAKGDYVLIQDADLEYDPNDISRLLEPIINNKSQVVYGSRFLGPHTNLFFLHMLANKFLSLLTNILFDSTLSDMEVGYKLFPLKLLKQLNLRERCFGFEPEVTAKILKRKIRIFEVPISYSGREYHEGKKITWKDGFKAIYYLFKYKLIN